MKVFMDTIQIANILLTRRCNLRCDYCSIVRDYDKMPVGYPKMDYYHKHELNAKEWIHIIKKLKENNHNIFLIFYGGEPFLYPELEEIIKYCYLKEIYYTIISNNTEEIQPKILELYKKIGTIRGFSASIDPDLFKYINYRLVSGLSKVTNLNDHSIKKTLFGYENLKKLKENNIADDVVAEITATSENCKDLYNTVKILSESEIYSSITTIDLKQSSCYDFSTITDKNLLVTKEMIAKQFMDIISDETLKVHIPQMLIKLYDILPCDMKCQIYKDVSNVTIDSDGSFRLCLRIRGINTPKLKVDQFLEHGYVTELAKNEMKIDYNNMCLGCNWTCMLHSRYYQEQIINH